MMLKRDLFIEEAFTRGELLELRASDRAAWPTPAPPVVGPSPAQTVEAMAIVVADAYGITVEAFKAAATFPIRRLRAATAATARDVYGLDWATIGDGLGYNNPRSSVNAARPRHPELIVEVAAILKNAAP